jgi:hypothetical protein
VNAATEECGAAHVFQYGVRHENALWDRPLDSNRGLAEDIYRAISNRKFEQRQAQEHLPAAGVSVTVSQQDRVGFFLH